MNTSTSSLQASAPPLARDMPASARRVVNLLQKLRHGSLSVMWPNGSTTQFGQHDDARPSLHAHLHLHNWKPLSEAIKSGDIGFAEGYIAGDWSTPHLPELLQLLVANRREMEDLIYGHWLGRLVYRVRHLLHRNTRRNSVKNIHAHYDLGNAFYQLWLDPTMNYSSAWFGEDRSQDLSQAQNAKVHRALCMVGVKPGDRVMEIGCGWGALAEMGGLEFGARMHQRAQCFGVARTAIAKHDRFNQRGPTEIVNVVKRRAGIDQHFDDEIVAEMGGGDQRRAVVTTGDLFRTGAQLQQHAQRADVVGHCRDGHRVIAIAFFRIDIGAGLDQRGDGIAVLLEGRHMQRRAAVAVTHVEVGAARGELFDFRRIAARRCREHAGILRDLAGGRRNLRTGIQHGRAENQRAAPCIEPAHHQTIDFKMPQVPPSVSSVIASIDKPNAGPRRDAAFA